MIDRTLEFHAAAGAPPTWVLSNHDPPAREAPFIIVDRYTPLSGEF